MPHLSPGPPSRAKPHSKSGGAAFNLQCRRLGVVCLTPGSSVPAGPAVFGAAFAAVPLDAGLDGDVAAAPAEALEGAARQVDVVGAAVAHDHADRAARGRAVDAQDRAEGDAAWGRAEEGAVSAVVRAVGQVRVAVAARIVSRVAAPVGAV